MSAPGWYKGTKTWNNNFDTHAGQTRRLFLHGTNDYSYATNFFVDDVTFWTYCGALSAGDGEDTNPDGWTWQKTDAPPGYLQDRTPGFRQ
jgi:hypothetical protein